MNSASSTSTSATTNAHRDSTPRLLEAWRLAVAAGLERPAPSPETAGRATNGDSSLPVDARQAARANLVRLVGAVDPTAPPRPQTELIVTGRWDGVVIEVDEPAGLFRGRFVPEGSAGPEMSADFLLDEVEPDDRELVAVGALFYATAGRVKITNHRWQATSAIQFRRLPPLRSDDVDEALKHARKTRQKLGLE